MKIIQMCLVTFFVCIMTGCNKNLVGYVSPVTTLPKTDIAYLARNTEKGSVIGFINSDGSERSERMIYTSRGILFENDILRYFSADTSAPFAWNSKYELGLLRNSSIRLNAGYPVVISPEGKVYSCPNNKSPWTTKPYFIKGDSLIILDESNIDERIIIDFNYKKCEINNIVYKPFTENETISSFTISSEGIVAVGIVISNYHTYSIITRIISNTTNNVINIQNATKWRWSRSGSRNLYIQPFDNQMIVCLDINRNCKKFGDSFYNPSFSADDNWIIFDYAGKISRKNINTLEVEFITNGEYPISQSW